MRRVVATNFSVAVQVAITYKSILRIALPISISIFIPQINFLANTAFLGRVGEFELGINGIAGVYYLMLAMIGYGLSSGLQVQMARRAGEGDQAGLTRLLRNGLVLALLLSVVLFIVSWWLAPVLFGYTLAGQGSITLTKSFLQHRLWGIGFLLVAQVLNAYFISIGESKKLVYAAVLGTVINILLDYLLIFGHYGFPKMSLNGAAIASVISELASMVLLLLLLRPLVSKEATRKIQSSWFQPREAWKSFVLATPLIVQFLFSIGGWQLFFILLERLGARELAASQILRSVIGMVSIGCWALASTCNMMVSNVIGQGKTDEVFKVIKMVLRVSMLYAGVVCLLLLLFPVPFFLLYRNDVAFAEFAVPAMRVVTVACFLMSISTVLFNAVVGTGNTRTNLLIEILCVGMYVLYCYVVVEKYKASLAWAWGSDFVYWGSLAICSLLYLKYGRWRGKHV